MKNIEIESSNLMQSFEDCEVPEGWLLTRLRDGLILDIQPGFACGKNFRDRRGIPHLRPMNVTEKGQIDLTDLKFVPESECSKPERFVHNGDIIFNNTNSPELVGKTAYYSLQDPRAFSNHMTRLRCNTNRIDPVFCAMVLHQKWREGYFKSVCNNHVSQSSISRNILLNTHILLPPLTEQRRIVARVEALLTQVNAARDRLNSVPLIMKRFRQAVLAAACSGRLTEGWREEHPDELSSYEAIINFFNGVKNRNCLEILQKRTKKSEIILNQERYPEIPESWCWITLEKLAALEKNAITDGPFGSNLKTEHYSVSGPRVIRLQNIGDGFFIDIKTHIFESHFKSLIKHQIFPGDVLIALLGEPIPRSCVVPDDIGQAIVKADCIRFKPNSEVVLAKFINYTINEPEIRSQIKESIHGVARPRLNLTHIKNYPLPLPPLYEQHEIVRRVEALFGIADQIEHEVAVATKRTEALTQAVLAKAFRGELVGRESGMQECF